MALSIESPTKGQKFIQGKIVKFHGHATDGATKVTLTTPFNGAKFDLGTFLVNSGNWGAMPKFNRAGVREVIAHALNDEGEVLGTASVKFVVAPDPDALLPVQGSVGNPHVTTKFKEKVIKIADKLETDPNFLMAIMSFETGGSFDPAQQSHAGNGATGLIQFLKSTAKSLGTTTAELAAMTSVEQLDFVEKFLLPQKGKIQTIEDIYMAVLFPKAVGKPNSFVLFQTPSQAFKLNKGLDADKDGKVTKAEAAARPRKILEDAKAKVK